MMKKMKTKTKLKKSSFLESSRPSIQTVPRNYDFSTDFSSVSSAKEFMPCFQTAPPKYDIRTNIEEYEILTDSSSVSSENEFMLSRMPFDSSPGQGQVECLPELDVDYYTDDYEEDIELSKSIYHTPNTSLDGNDNDHLASLTKEIDGMIAYDNFMCSSISELGKSANISKVVDDPTDFVCTLCVEHKEAHERFDIKNCSHAYYTDCMVNYVASKLQENITSIRCPVPDCVGLLEPEYCRPILPPDVFDRWGSALCEAVILGSEKFYCPYKDCSAMLIDDGTEVVRQSACPNCWRMFCAQCKVPWHEGIKCEEFLKDIMLMDLAQKQQWRRCPKCRFYVDRWVACS